MTPATGAMAPVNEDTKVRKKRRWDDSSSATSQPSFAISKASALSIPARGIVASTPSTNPVSSLTAPISALPLSLQQAIAKAKEKAALQQQRTQQPQSPSGAAPNGAAAVTNAANASHLPIPKAGTGVRSSQSKTTLSSSMLSTAQGSKQNIITETKRETKKGTKSKKRKGKDAVISEEASDSIKKQKQMKEEEQVKKSPEQNSASIDISIDKSPTPYFDPNVPYPKERKPRGLSFVAPGTYIAKAETMRLHQLDLELKKQKDAEKAFTKEQVIGNHEIPISLEWWDELFLAKDSYHALFPNWSSANPYELLSTIDPNTMKFSKISSYIFHPVPLTNPILIENHTAKPLPLTKQEARKVKRRENLAAQKELQEKIKLGIVQPPPNKMRIANLMNVLLNESIAQPSEYENKIRKEIEERHAKHLEVNEQRKIDAGPKEERLLRKYTEDLSHGVHVLVCICKQLTSGNRYLIEANAELWHCTGRVILLGNHPRSATSDPPPESNGIKLEQAQVEMSSSWNDWGILVIEAGPKNIARMKKLLTKRINWKKSDSKAAKIESQNNIDSSASMQDDDTSSHCEIAWEGIVSQPTYGNFSIKFCKSDLIARGILEKENLTHYWNLATTARDRVMATNSVV